MKIDKNIVSFLENSSKLSDGNTLYFCDSNKIYLQLAYKQKCCFVDLNLSHEIKDIIKNMDDIYFKNNIEVNIVDNTLKENYSGFMVHKINRNYFLISCNNKICFDDYHIDYAKNTIFFLKQMLNKKQDNKKGISN